MCHVQQSTGCIALNAHVLRLGQSGQRAQGSRPCNLCLVLFMSRQVGDAPNRIALHFDVWRHHLANQGGQSSKQHDGNLILGYSPSASIHPTRPSPHGWLLRYVLLTARFPRAALAALCTSMSEFCNRNRIGSSVSRSTSRTSAPKTNAIRRRSPHLLGPTRQESMLTYLAR